MFTKYIVSTLIAAVAILASQASADTPEASPAEIKAAVSKALPLIEKSAAQYLEKRSCFGCHHQALPVLTITEAKTRGFAIDEENLKAQLKRAADHLERGKENYLAGKGQGGGIHTAGYALWTLEAGGRKSDEVTAAVAGYLASYQKNSDHWSRPGTRPPTQGSDFTVTYLAVRGLGTFSSKDQAEQSAARQGLALEWLLKNKGKDTEDRTFRLRALHYLNAKKGAIKKAAKRLIAAQREDGGWAQKDDMTSDAYATGTTLVALHEAGAVSAGHPAYQRGLKYLLDSQLDDGSWHVRTRAKPIQTYFESGFPHAKDQFISISASCWSTMALLAATPKP